MAAARELLVVSSAEWDRVFCEEETTS